MRFSSALSLAIAPVALAKSTHNLYPVKRSSGRTLANSVQLSSDPVALEQLIGLGMSGAGLSQGGGSILKTDVLLIWVNGGNNVATTQINQQQPQPQQQQQQQIVTTTTTLFDNSPAPTPAVDATPVSAVGAAAPAAPAAVGGAPVTHNVTVGGPKGLIFEPQQITAAVGDMVIFKFLSQNHTVTQSAFDTPCDPLAGGMDSGFQGNPNNTVVPPPLVAMQVMVATPLWFYCRAAAGAHCGKGMVFSINPTAAKTHSAFASKAIASKGLGGGGVITGNAGAAAPAAAAPAAAAPAAAAPAAAAPAAAAPAAAGSSGSATVGKGTLGADGSCQCVVTCASGSFPAAAQGINNIGGLPGSIPSNMLLGGV